MIYVFALREPRMTRPTGEESALDTGNGVYFWKVESYRGTPEEFMNERKLEKKQRPLLLLLMQSHSL